MLGGILCLEVWEGEGHVWGILESLGQSTKKLVSFDNNKKADEGR